MCILTGEKPVRMLLQTMKYSFAPSRHFKRFLRNGRWAYS
jgi:hypothetical protein